MLAQNGKWTTQKSAKNFSYSNERTGISFCWGNKKVNFKCFSSIFETKDSSLLREDKYKTRENISTMKDDQDFKEKLEKKYLRKEKRMRNQIECLIRRVGEFLILF